MASDKKVIALGGQVNSRSVGITNPLAIQSMYANDFGIGFTITDVRLVFAELGLDLVSGVPTKILKANILLPLHGAEALANSLLEAVKAHKKDLKNLTEAVANAQTAKPAKPVS
jgi:hypothetical protein